MRYFLTAFLLMLAGCASFPNGPSVAVMPAPGKPFDQFAQEDQDCKRYAQQSIGTTAEQAATNSELKSIAAGTAIGAVAGALGGGHHGTESGAAVGLLGGAMTGANAAHYSGHEAQRRYDIAYEQCMYAKGNQLPQASVYLPRIVQPPTDGYYYPPNPAKGE